MTFLRNEYMCYKHVNFGNEKVILQGQWGQGFGYFVTYFRWSLVCGFTDGEDSSTMESLLADTTSGILFRIMFEVKVCTSKSEYLESSKLTLLNILL